MNCCKKIVSIFEGWRNVIFRNPVVERIAIERAKICSGCEDNTDNWCVKCKCWIPAKARSISERCDKWDNSDEKYEPYL